MGKLIDDPKLAGKGIALRATGSSLSQMSKALGVSRHTATDLVKKYENQINELCLQVIEDSIVPVRENHKNTLQLARQILQYLLEQKDDAYGMALKERMVSMGVSARDILTLADRKEYRFLQMTQMLPSHATATSVFIAQLFQSGQADGTTQELEILNGLLKWKATQDLKPALVDGEIVEGDIVEV